MFGPTDLLIGHADPNGDGGTQPYGPDSDSPEGLLFGGLNLTAVSIHRNDTSSPWPEDVARVEAANPIKYVTNSTPPMYIAHGLADEKVSIEMSEKMADSLQLVGVEHVFEKVPGGGS